MAAEEIAGCAAGRAARTAHARDGDSREARDILPCARSAGAPRHSHARTRPLSRGRLDRDRASRHDRERCHQRSPGCAGVARGLSLNVKDPNDGRNTGDQEIDSCFHNCPLNLLLPGLHEVADRSLPGDRAQGEEPAVVHHAARAQPARGDARHRRARGPGADGPDRGRARRRRPNGTIVRERVARVFGVANFARAGRAPLDVDAIAAAILGDLGPEDPASFRVSVRRADKRFPMTSPEIEREVGGRIKEARGWHVDLGNPELTIHVETLTNQAFYSFGKRAGRRRAADRRQRARRVPALRRHRLAGRGLADDAARLPGRVRALPQLSDPVARVAGEGARAGEAADAVPAPLAAVARAVRRDPAAVVLSVRAAAARRDLPPADDADRRGAGA